jgi:hypothetical protein
MLGADFGRDLERGLQHLHVARQPPGLIHEVDRQRTVHGITDLAAGAGGAQAGELRALDPAADDQVHVVGRQLDGLDAERGDHVQLRAEVGEVVRPLVCRYAGPGDAVCLHDRYSPKARATRAAQGEMLVCQLSDTPMTVC